MSSATPTQRPGSRGRAGLLLVVVVLLLVNLPVVHSTWLRSQVERSGVDVQAAVLGEVTDGGVSAVRVELPAEVGGEKLDADERRLTAEVTDDAREAAVASGRITVRVLPDRPSSYVVEGEVRGSGVLVVTLVADLLILGAGLLLWRFRQRLRPELVLVANGDVERCPPGPVLDRVEGDEYVVAGEVESIAEDRLVLLVGERRVVVELDGHANPVGHQQSARVRGRMVG